MKIESCQAGEAPVAGAPPTPLRRQVSQAARIDHKGAGARSYRILAFEKLMKTHPSRRIPAVTNLLVFELCARHLSFTRAGQILGLSQGAISRQVGELEDYLGQALFLRSQRSLGLTPAGLRYAALIRPHLQGLEQATAEMRQGQARASVLRVSVSISLCNRWLISRMPDLLRRHPDLAISLSPDLVTTRSPEMWFVETELGAADVQIVHRAMPPPASENAELLLPIPCSAICAPQLLAEAAPLDLEGLLRLPLLHYAEVPGLWQEYVNDAGRPDLAVPAGPANVSILVNIQFALAGMGVALLPEYLIEEELASGTLVRAYGHRYRTGRAYYLTYPESRRHWPAAVAFREWVAVQARECRQRYD